jgi:membrane protein implicated in regulation of membrane protease activity
LHIVAIAWMYVVVLMAVLERSWLTGLMTVLLYGVLPLSILIYLFGTPGRRRRAQRQTASGLADQVVRETDGPDAKQDQGNLPKGG